MIEKTRLNDQEIIQLNSRQDKVIAQLIATNLEGFTGWLSAENYLAIMKTFRATATRDLQSLVEMSVLQRTGERKHTRHTLNSRSMSGAT